jgi:hypothetical protein
MNPRPRQQARTLRIAAEQLRAMGFSSLAAKRENEDEIWEGIADKVEEDDALER